VTTLQSGLAPNHPSAVSSSTSQPDSPQRADGSDLRLVQRAQSGESRAFDQLALKYRPRVVNLAMRYTRNGADAEDIAQEVLIKAYRGLRHFRGECAFYTWVYRITINSAKNALRARADDPVGRIVDSIDDRGEVDYETRLHELETPEELTSADDIHSAVNAALEALPEALRTAIMLRELDHLTYEEIAAAMASPMGTVRSRVFRAREFIHDQLRQIGDIGLGRDNRRRPSSAQA
jgi:RNA polymerase sigma-70 factor (ECF subfamily)